MIYFEDDSGEKEIHTPEWPGAQPAVLDDGGADFGPGDGAEYGDLSAPLVSIPYGIHGEELVWNREHAVVIDLAHESGLHLDPNSELELANNVQRHDGPISHEGNGCYGLWILGKVKSMFPDWWTVEDLTRRFTGAIQNGQFTVANEEYQTESGRMRTRKVLVGVMDPADYAGADFNAERPVAWMARMVPNTNMIGTVFPITRSRYQKFVSAAQAVEEKDDFGSALQAPDHGVEQEELNLDNWDQDAQDNADEQSRSALFQNRYAPA